MAASFLKTIFQHNANCRPINANARAAQDLPMGRANSFPISHSVLLTRSPHNDMPHSLIKQGGNWGSIWVPSRNCIPGNPRNIIERGWF